MSELIEYMKGHTKRKLPKGWSDMKARKSPV